MKEFSTFFPQRLKLCCYLHAFHLRVNSSLKVFLCVILFDILQFCGNAASTVAKRQNLEEEGNCYCEVQKREVITTVGEKLRLLWF